MSGGPDFGGNPTRTTVLVGSATVAGAAVGAMIGQARQTQDVVTIENRPYPETVQVPVGTRTVHGCYEYHYGYDAMEGEFGYHYGYNPSCTEQQTVYETQLTGRTLYQEIKHHTVGFPNTVLQGALLGAGVGLVGGVAAAVLLNSIDP